MVGFGPIFSPFLFSPVPMSRNSMCSCGSGKRYKHCCGRETATPSQARFDALAAHRAGSLGKAESLYRRALDEYPNDTDCLHMLGVVQMERMRYREALDLMWNAAERTGWAQPQIRHNLGLVLGKLLACEANAKQADLLAEFVAWEQARRQSKTDAYIAPDRIACMVDEIARAGVRWGFSLVSNVNHQSEEHAAQNAGEIDIRQKQLNFLGTQPNSFTLVEYNVAVSSGNLFVERDFFFELDGFRDYRYNHDWDFGLRASALAEPVVVHRSLYFYRIHENNTIAESKERSTRDAERVIGEFLATALS